MAVCAENQRCSEEFTLRKTVTRLLLILALVPIPLLARQREKTSHLLWHSYMVIFDPLVYPMDTIWLNGKVPTDHYRLSRPAYLRTLQHAGLVFDSNSKVPVNNGPESQSQSEPTQESDSTEEKL